MSYHSRAKSSISEQATAANGTSNAGNCCSRAASSELKLYQTFIFSVPIFFTFVLLLLFYLFYLRRRRVDWSSLRMRTARSVLSSSGIIDEISRCELGLQKELREMLPIIIFKESFCVNDTQCSVCLGDFEAEEKLQQIPGCGHTFHMDCIDLWLSTHTTCPLCRHSLITVTKLPPSSNELVVIVPTLVGVGIGNDDTSSLAQTGDDETFLQNVSQSNGDPQTSVHDSSVSTIADERVAAPSVRDPHGIDIGKY